ncbi:MAG: BMP family ABC transporter substrate-binding protein [Clostridiales bacterium]|nr:BMP family ABC transporter substrate-binding protein [Clostridiales bacterium]
MKKSLFVVLALLFATVLLAGCGGNGGGGQVEAVTLANIKVGFVHITNPSDMGYTYNHHQGTLKMMQALGLKDDQVINKFDISEDGSCETALRELVESGCNIIFGTSFGFENFMMEVARDYPNIQFCHATGYQAADSGLDNMHNYFGAIYQARYLSGIAAGLKTNTNKLGYVSAQPFAECISGYTAFYLGALSVNPHVVMEVIYTNDWNNPTAESRAAQALIDRGADVLGQHADSTATQTTAEARGVWGVGYNSNMISAAPNASLTSAVWDWSIYLTFAIKTLVDGGIIPVDWSGGLAEGVCDVSALNEAIIAPGTAEAIEAARQRILGGWDVFTGPLYDNQGNLVIKEGETFVEPQSAPSFDYILQGITVIE